MNLLEVANMQLAAGNKQAAERTLYGSGLTWHDLSQYQQARTKLQRPPPEHELPPSLRGGLAGTRGLTNRIPSWNYVAPKFPLFRQAPAPPKKVGPWRMPINTGKHPTYQSPPIIGRPVMQVPGVSWKVPKGVMAGLSSVADATLASAMPDDNATIQDQLASIRMDWATGNLWVGNNKYSLVTTLIGGLVIKGMLFGGSKIAAFGKKAVGVKPATA